MSFSYDLSTEVGKVRFLIPDSREESYVLEDAEIEFLLTQEDGYKRAAALGLETIASNEVLVLKVIKLLDISTDGAKVSDALLKRAALLRSQAEEDALADGGGFDIAQWVVDDFTYRQRVWNEALRA